jgi:hypothetical protein
LLSIRTIENKGEQCSGGEGVSQSPLKNKAFSKSLDQNPLFELRPERQIAAATLNLIRAPKVRG